MQRNYQLEQIRNLEKKLITSQIAKNIDESFQKTFWCQKINSDVTNCCFSHKVGMPQHPATLQPMQYMSHQIQFVDYVTKDDRQKKVHVNKSRQIGFTEIVLRAIQFLCFGKYAGGKIMIIAGTREKTSKKIMQRFKQLFDAIPEYVKSSSDLITVLTNGTTIEALPSSSEAIRGDTKINCVFIDEAAFFNRIDDSIVMDAVRPIIMTNKSDFFVISTPNGPQGFFHAIEKSSSSDYYMMHPNIWNAVGIIYTKEEAEEELKRTDVDVEQEYLNQYTTGRDSIFGKIMDEDEEEMKEWK
ncbi:terminase family protein [archaeon]|nr:terminase family protein [archaeon]